MDLCARCGHALGVGRYCVNCGQARDSVAGPPDDAGAPTLAPRDDVTSTAERPAVRVDPTVDPDVPPAAPPEGSPWTVEPAGPIAPPPVYETPQRPRFPMYADDPAPPPRTPSTPLPAVIEPVPAETSVVPAVWESDDPRPGGRGRRSVLPWVAVAVALLLVAGVGVFLLLGGPGNDDDQAVDPGPGRSTSATDDPEPTNPDTGEPSSDTEPASPTMAPGESEDVSGSASVEAPTTADPGVDVDGQPVSYDAANMLDDRPDTAWRSPGSAAGETIAVTLDEPTRLTSVGLINGYAKKDPGYDGYFANRRVLEVEWTFDDGSTATQTFGKSRQVQTLKVDVVTSSVSMRLVSVSDPGRGRQGRDFTAISTIELLGSPDQTSD